VLEAGQNQFVHRRPTISIRYFVGAALVAEDDPETARVCSQLDRGGARVFFRVWRAMKVNRSVSASESAEREIVVQIDFLARACGFSAAADLN
jgi:hypothetical protein